MSSNKSSDFRYGKLNELNTILDEGLGGPEKISNSIRQLQTPLTTVQFHADLKSGLHFNLRGRTPEHKRIFEILSSIRRFTTFKAFFFLLVFHITALSAFESSRTTYIVQSDNEIEDFNA